MLCSHTWLSNYDNHGSIFRTDAEAYSWHELLGGLCFLQCAAEPENYGSVQRIRLPVIHICSSRYSFVNDQEKDEEICMFLRRISGSNSYDVFLRSGYGSTSPLYHYGAAVHIVVYRTNSNHRMPEIKNCQGYGSGVVSDVVICRFCELFCAVSQAGNLSSSKTLQHDI